MKKIEKTIFLEKFPLAQLDDQRKKLVSMAILAIDKAYAPYSGFKVGTALLLEDGQTFSANNQENICFPVGVCAERLLLGYTHANNPDIPPLILAIAAKKADGSGMATVTPCGLCRQSISEYEMKFNRPIEILMYMPDDHVLKAKGIDQLLPYKFEDLNK
ncbi:MAG: cytidine deaminase [Cyclobacteriaceae bacterium]